MAEHNCGLCGVPNEVLTVLVAMCEPADAELLAAACPVHADDIRFISTACRTWGEMCQGPFTMEHVRWREAQIGPAAHVASNMFRVMCGRCSVATLQEFAQAYSINVAAFRSALHQALMFNQPEVARWLAGFFPAATPQDVLPWLDQLGSGTEGPGKIEMLKCYVDSHRVDRQSFKRLFRNSLLRGELELADYLLQEEHADFGSRNDLPISLRAGDANSMFKLIAWLDERGHMDAFRAGPFIAVFNQMLVCGSAELVDFVVGRGLATPEGLASRVISALAAGHLEMVRAFAERYAQFEAIRQIIIIHFTGWQDFGGQPGFTVSEAIMDSFRISVAEIPPRRLNSAFLRLCKAGALRDVQWAAAAFGTTEFRAGYLNACQAGRADTASWIWETHLHDMCGCINQRDPDLIMMAFLDACSAGSLECAQMLVPHVDFTDGHTRAQTIKTLAVCTLKPAVFRWLAVQCGLEAAEVDAMLRKPYVVIDLPELQWLIARWELAPAQIRECGQVVASTCGYFKRIDILDWLWH